ncbi:N-acetylglucosaminyldiphosphodolichol N-acetylglucosaminyltransferase catalytic subunit alg13, partial [Cryomyces antarcticus]
MEVRVNARTQLNIEGFDFNAKGLAAEMRAVKGEGGREEGVVISHAGAWRVPRPLSRQLVLSAASHDLTKLDETQAPAPSSTPSASASRSSSCPTRNSWTTTRSSWPKRSQSKATSFTEVW